MTRAPSQTARMMAFAIVTAASKKHGARRHARAARFAARCGDKSARLGRGRALWDEVAALCHAEAAR